MQKIRTDASGEMYVAPRFLPEAATLSLQFRDDETSEEETVAVPYSSYGDLIKVDYTLSTITLRENARYSWKLLDDQIEVCRGTAYCTDNTDYSHTIFEEPTVNSTDLADRKYVV